MASRAERRALAREAAKLLLQHPSQRRRFRWDWSLALILAIVAVVMSFRPPQDGVTALEWLAVMFVLGVYPSLHFFEWIFGVQRRTVAYVIGIGIWGVAVFLFGLHVWPNMGITFKEAPEFTWWRRRVIEHDVSSFRNYLFSLSLELPSAMPPFSINENENGYGISTPGLQKYRDELAIGSLRVKDRTRATRVYGAYAMEQRFHKSKSNNLSNINSFLYTVALSDSITSYLNSSYWARKVDVEDPFFNCFWEMRGQLGSHFVNRLAARTLEVMEDSPTEGRDEDRCREFSNKVEIADSTLESKESAQRMQPYIDTVILRHCQSH